MVNLPKITLARKSASDQLFKNLKTVTGTASYVGVPAERSTRKKEKINNAELLFVLSKGSPARHLPATPWIEPALAAEPARSIIADELRNYGAATISATLPGGENKSRTDALRHLKRAGMAGQNAAREWPTDSRNNWPPLAASTVKGRLRRMGKGKAGKAARKSLAGLSPGTAAYDTTVAGLFTRNVDTGALRSAITHVEREG